MTEGHRTAVTSSDGTTIAIQSLGSGEGVVLVGGALRRGTDYLPLARLLAERFCVHIVDRRGRGGSGPLGADYSLARECEDLAAVVAATGAQAVFGHSFGGLVALQAAARFDLFRAVTVYEPAVSVAGSLASGWLDRYEQRLAAGDPRGAFVALVRGTGEAPAALARMPDWYVRLVLRAAVRGQRWRETESLLEAALSEHREVAREEVVDAYRGVDADVLVVAGARSSTRQRAALGQLAQALPHGRLQVVPGLDHLAPEKAPGALADVVAAGLSTSPAA
jgi:pimeloyl-ACP methyl ester carboxylesterase